MHHLVVGQKELGSGSWRLHHSAQRSTMARMIAFLRWCFDRIDCEICIRIRAHWMESADFARSPARMRGSKDLFEGY